MRIVCFSHPLLSCWNHGNTHFLRGVVLRELVHRNHPVTTCEPETAWSRQNLVNDCGPAAVDGFAGFYPELCWPSVTIARAKAGSIRCWMALTSSSSMNGTSLS